MLTDSFGSIYSPSHEYPAAFCGELLFTVPGVFSNPFMAPVFSRRVITSGGDKTRLFKDKGKKQIPKKKNNEPRGKSYQIYSIDHLWASYSQWDRRKFSEKWTKKNKKYGAWRLQKLFVSIGLICPQFDITY